MRFPLDALFCRLSGVEVVVVIVARAMMVAVAVATAAAQYLSSCAFAAAASCPNS